MTLSRRNRAGLALLSVLTAGALALPSFVQAQDTVNVLSETAYESVSLQQAFEEAAAEFGVPLNVLMSVAYNQTRWEDHHGHHSAVGGYGVMHLTEFDPENNQKGDLIDVSEPLEPIESADESTHTLDTAAELIGVSPEVLKHDMKQNIRGGAALLAKHARDTVGELPADAADWYGAVAKYSGTDIEEIAGDFADRVYATIQQGAERTTTSGHHVKLAAQAVTPDTSTADPLHLRQAAKSGADCPNGLACRYIPAAYKQFSASKTNYGNYDLASRPADGLDIRYIIIHDMEGSYLSAIRHFQNASFASAHYNIRSSDGAITQMVREKDIAWHGGNWFINTHSIGIEHEGYASQGGWYTEQMYHATAKLVKELAERYDIPLDRQHIIGHDELPGLTPYNHTRMHWDPGAYWDWSHFFNLLGASFNPSNGDKNSGIVTINPNFKTNQPTLTYNGKLLEAQPAAAVPLYTAPSFDAPLINDPHIQSTGLPGTTAINDWSNKAVIGRNYIQADQAGDWTAIWFGGKKAWFHNPNDKNTTPGSGLKITPREGLDSIPVYGSAFPEAAAYAEAGVSARLNTPLLYRIPAGQEYVASDAVQSSYYHAKLFNDPESYRVVKGQDEFYQISFGHRIAFVKKSDVEVVE